MNGTNVQAKKPICKCLLVAAAVVCVSVFLCVVCLFASDDGEALRRMCSCVY